ncbi:formate hydrogenlyase regulatory protein [Escherichia coli]|nr:formate hydrogenlyase regulatory protein [Escherichia coli]
MTIWEISEKADTSHSGIVAYRTSGTSTAIRWFRGSRYRKARLHHAMSCAPDKELCFVLFEHFRIYVTLADGFNSHTIEYYVETKDGEDKQRIAQAQLSIDGMIDGKVNIRGSRTGSGTLSRKIAGVYDSLYTAIENNVPVNLSQLVKGQSPAA